MLHNINLPEEIINIIMEFYINDLNSLIMIIGTIPENIINIREYNYFDKFYNTHNSQEMLCKYIQQNNVKSLKILLTKFNFYVKSKQFTDICKYNSLDVVKTIYDNNKFTINIYKAIHAASLTFNNRVLEWLYYNL